MPASTAGMVEGCTGRQADEIYLVLSQRAYLPGQVRQSRSDRKTILVADIEPIDILGRDGGIGADVDHIDPIHLVLKVLQGLGNDSPGD